MAGCYRWRSGEKGIWDGGAHWWCGGEGAGDGGMGLRGQCLGKWEDVGCWVIVYKWRYMGWGAHWVGWKGGEAHGH